MVKKISLLLLIALSLNSCVSSKKIHYFQGLSNQENKTSEDGGSQNFETRIKTGDALMIIVSASDPVAAIPFNLPSVATLGMEEGDLDRANGTSRFQVYLVDRNGEIEFPVLGKIVIGGLTKEQALQKLSEQLIKYIDDPIVNLRIVNYKVSVIGEVNKPGTFDLSGERISLPEAISRAGDLTIYGNRSEVLLIRDINGVKSHYMLDLTSSDIINSPLFYLQQNDVVYVKPNKVRVNASGVGPNTTVIISSVSLLLTVIALLTR